MSISLSGIESRIPSDHYSQVDAEHYIRQIGVTSHIKFLDVGAGDGRSFDTASRSIPNLEWTGIDIEGSYEVSTRTRTDCTFMSYDGINLPFPDDQFDIVYSRQVFEHVRHPEPLLASIARVLKPDGYFIGSVSQMEPLHSYSLYNFTYYGFAVLAEHAGLSLEEYRPGIDGFSLAARHFMIFGAGADLAGLFANMFSSNSTVNDLIESFGKSRSMCVRDINKLKITYCGHLCFKFRKER